LQQARLIITGDDFGISSAVNEAVERDFQAGLLTQASFIVTGKAADEAVRIARRHPRLRVGLHLILCSGSALTRSGLTDRDRALPSSPLRAGLRYAFSPRSRAGLAGEVAAQFQQFRSFQLGNLYWDGHHHLHLHPRILLSALASAAGFRFVRLVRNPRPRTFVGAVFNALSRAARPRLDTLGVRYADAVFGLESTGRMGTAQFLQVLARLPNSVSELYYHPGAERSALDVSPVLEAISRLRIQTGSYDTLIS
jgi:predicted glycoside hydrolase/deacetylase ChbG (UPF0249 family)